MVRLPPPPQPFPLTYPTPPTNPPPFLPRAITRDETLYPSPETFDPSRWLTPTSPCYLAPLSTHPTIKGFTTFGYGRRVCQGVDLVEAELLVGVGGMAWAFRVGKKRDALGREVEVPRHDYTSLLISRPKPFGFELGARSVERGVAVRENWRRVREERERERGGVREGKVGGAGAGGEMVRLQVGEGGLSEK